MNRVGKLERVTQNRVVKIFQQQLEYCYLSNWEKRANNSNVEAGILGEYLAGQDYSQTLIEKAIAELNKTANQTKSLYDINQEVYGLLRYGVKVKENVGENNQTVWLIDWENPLENDFAIAEEVAVEGDDNGNKRPDIVIYINGIALGVIELICHCPRISTSFGTQSRRSLQSLGDRFKAYMTRFMPTWSFYKDELNRLPITLFE